MYGVVSLLDEHHHQLMEDLWEEFQEHFGVHGWEEFQERFRAHRLSLTPAPHFSYHVAEKYEANRLAGVLEGVAQKARPFTIKTTGLGLFTGTTPTLYVAVHLTPELAALHKRLWEALSSIAVSSSVLYHPDNWQPHITLTHDDVKHDFLPKVVRLLSERDFRWQITIDNLSVLGDTPNPEEQAHGLLSRVPFGG